MDKKHEEDPRHVNDGPTQSVRRKRTTRVYNGSGRYDERWTTSTKIQHTLTTDTNKRHERKVPHKFYGNDGCVRHDERRTRSTKIQYTFTTDTNDRSTMVQHTIYDESERHIFHGGYERYDERWIRSTKIQRHVNDGYERKVQHKFYDKSKRHVLTTDSNDTMKDGPRRSDEDARHGHVNDGCERNGYI